MTTNCLKLATKIVLYGYVVVILPLESAQSLPWCVRRVQERYLPRCSAMSDVQYCVLKPIRRSAGSAWRPIYGRKADVGGKLGHRHHPL